MLFSRFNPFPNDELALYGEGDFRIRTLTPGGFSPDGVTALFPNAYEDFFALQTGTIPSAYEILRTSFTPVE